MRFLVDEDVDATLCRLLRRRGHQCWTVPEAGLSGADDDEVAVYADEQHAVLLTHDAKVIRRRRRRTFGRHVLLRCPQPDAVTVLAGQLDELIAQLHACGEGVYEVSRSGVRYHPPQWQ